MRNYNVMRPIMIILVAVLSKNLVTSLLILFGMEPNAASNIGIMAMVIAALLTFNRMTRKQRK